MCVVLPVMSWRATLSAQHSEPKNKGRGDERNTFGPAGGFGPVVKYWQAIRRSRELKIRGVRHLVVPPRRVGRGVQSEALIKGIAQVLQARSDDPRSAAGVGGDLELWKRKSTTAVAFLAGYNFILEGRRRNRKSLWSRELRRSRG